jgi:hypothetical protein
MSNTNLFSRITEKQPVLDFMIKKEDFYINTHGVSISELGKSYTNFSDGVFYVLNKNSKPIYFDGIYLSNVKMRKESAYPASSMKIFTDKSEIIDDVLYEKYILRFRGNDVGELTIGRDLRFQNGSNFKLNPFQSISLFATYTTLNVNKINLHYYGKSNLSPNRHIGTIDVEFIIRSFSDAEFKNITNDVMTITINKINTGFVPESIAP